MMTRFVTNRTRITICATATLLAWLIGLSIPGAATAAQIANVIAINYVPGTPTIDIVVAIRKGIDSASRNGNADFGLRVTLTYVSVNNTVEISDSGRVSIKTDTVLLRPIDKGTVAIDLTMGFGSLPLPGNSPSFSATAQVFHRDPTTGDDDELGPAEQTFPR